MPAHTPRADVLAAVPALVDESGEIDTAANRALLTGLVGRVDGVFVAGTTGEFPALHRAERRELVGLALEIFGPDRVVAHIGAAATRDAVTLARDAVALGASRLAAITPYYLAVDTDAVTRHFAAITAAAGDAVVYGYLFPDRTGVAADAEEFARTAAETGLAGAKLSGAAAGLLAEFVAALPPGTPLWTGHDSALAAAVRAGGRGVVSGLSSAFPAPLAALADAVARGDAEAERTAQAEADEVAATLAGSPEAIKYALARQGIGTEVMRMPAPLVSAERRDRIDRLVAAVGAPVA
ncbi:dihydrodipicolinate synthase family protein [Pseudonocardia xinjiangensis]|uniref:Dihydrodipicolinate synthase family protein n=1 Tax=Pseudonocardia xinjiangensis TaxID=75289 RepID=A0ABX1RIX3_9PSEU|nr:dihydrodipicolinate synthase family protein [Pseudonocardia xinjiangensis]NMH80341.1 dihydrodipicolinate synthase family protein [Pseudonocardia xinjiangensis]